MTHTQQELDQIKEYERRLKAGLNPAPLVERVALEDIAGEVNLNKVLELEKIQTTSTALVRGKSLSFVTSSRRLLWQAFGQEHIEPELLDFIDQIPDNQTYFDIGASNGIFALYAATKNIKVVCFEPEVANFSLLNHNTFLNSKNTRFDVLNFNIGLSDENGLGSIYVEKYEPGGHLKILDSNIKRGDKAFSPDFKQAVLKYKLDDFLKLTKISNPNYIKIDVDGVEQQVLNGMKITLKDEGLRKIFIELEEEGENFEACNKILISNGFKIESHKRVQNYFGEENFIYSR
jgi:FkbM family methyltransferase